MLVVTELLRKCVDKNTNAILDQTEYNERYSDLVERYESAKSGLDEIYDKKLERTTKRESITAFMQTLVQRESLVTEFDDELWNSTVDKVTVYDEKLEFEFRVGIRVGNLIQKKVKPVY